MSGHDPDGSEVLGSGLVAIILVGAIVFLVLKIGDLDLRVQALERANLTTVVPK